MSDEAAVPPMAADATAPSNPSVAAGTHRVFWPGVLTVYTNHFTFTPDGGEPVTVTIPAV